MKDILKYSIALIVTFLLIELLSAIILSFIGIGPLQSPNYTRYRASGYYCYGNQPNTIFSGFDGFENNTYLPSAIPLTTNEYGLVSDKPLLMGKQKDTVKIMLQGGSAMFGSLQTQGVTDNDTYPIGEYSFNSSIAGILQDMLQNEFPGKTIQVINAAVVQHTFNQHYPMYVSLLHLFKPDIIITMDGYNDVPTIDHGDFYAYSEEVLNEFIKIEAEKRSRHFPYSLFLANYMLAKFNSHKAPVTNTGIKKSDLSFLAASDDLLAGYKENKLHFANNSQELFWIMEAYANALIRDSIYPIFCLQPMLGRKDIQKPLTYMENKLLKATRHSGRSGQIEQYFWGLYFAPKADSIMTKNKAAFIDLGKTIAGNMTQQQEAYMDYCHLTYPANKLVAGEIAKYVSTYLKQKK